MRRPCCAAIGSKMPYCRLIRHEIHERDYFRKDCMALSTDQLDGLAARLRAREWQLKQEISTVAEAVKAETMIGREVGDDAAHYALREEVSVDRAEMDRDALELQEVQSALARIQAGSYGQCVDCGVDIAHERLQAQPAAQRCTACQTRFERT